MNCLSLARYAFLVCDVALLLALPNASCGAEFHVANSGNDSNTGTRLAPLRSIQRAAELAQPADVITVHEGVYRERINPPRGGKSDAERIVYQAAPGEQVEVKGSEVVKGWIKVQEGVWKVDLPNSFFGDFNPFADSIHGDWFDPRGRQHHTGAVYLKGEWLTEAATKGEVLQPAAAVPLWFAQADEKNTTIWAQFKEVDPNQELVEINVRSTVFYPDQPGRNYITVRGFKMCQAATPWAPPTAEQIGLVGTHWSKGWIIENNEISHSTCSGIALGKYGDKWDNTSGLTAEGYVGTIERALKNGWNKDSIGQHVVRNNHISHCEQTGIVGSMGAAFSQVSGNVIHDIHVRKLFSGAEMAGIKFHGAIDTTIQHNHIYRTCRGIWLDWMAQGARISSNLMHDNVFDDLFVEVNHGPFVVDNNVLLSKVNLLDLSEGGAYLHNLLAGQINSGPDLTRSTPFHKPHSTAIAGLRAIRGGDDRFYNNIFVGGGVEPQANPARNDRPHRSIGYGLRVYDNREVPLQTGGNIYYRGAIPYAREVQYLDEARFDPKIELKQEGPNVYLQLTFEQTLADFATALVTTKKLGRTSVANLPFENADGSPLVIGTDYLGKTRSDTKPTPGPFESPGTGRLWLRVW